MGGTKSGKVTFYCLRVTDAKRARKHGGCVCWGVHVLPQKKFPPRCLAWCVCVFLRVAIVSVCVCVE